MFYNDKDNYLSSNFHMYMPCTGSRGKSSEDYIKLSEKQNHVTIFTRSQLYKRKKTLFKRINCYPADKWQIAKRTALFICRVQLYKGRITLSNGYIAIQQISDSKTYSVIHLTKIYPVDSVIQPLNNWGQYHTVHVHV